MRAKASVENLESEERQRWAGGRGPGTETMFEGNTLHVVEMRPNKSGDGGWPNGLMDRLREVDALVSTYRILLQPYAKACWVLSRIHRKSTHRTIWSGCRSEVKRSVRVKTEVRQ